MFSYNFLVRAVVVGALVSLCAALLGVSLVLKRYSMIGDGLSHVGFGALAIATALNVAPLSVSIPIVVAAAFLLLRLSENSKIKGDAAIAIISTGSLALGVMIIAWTTGMNTDVCNYLFGSILAMSKNDVYLSIALSIVVLLLFIVFYHKLFGITFDETFAKTSGVKVGIFNMLITFLTAITIVLGMRMMGAMLISSLIVFPALTSMRVFKTWKSVTISSAIVSIVCFFIGVVVSYVYATPTGASVVMMNIVAFIGFWVVSKINLNRQGRKGHKVIKPIFALSALFAVLFLSCSKNQPVETISAPAPAPIVKAKPVDNSPIEIKEKMFIAQTNEIYLNQEDYIGRTIKLAGLFMHNQYTNIDGSEGPVYNFVIRYGPGCCGYDGTAGFEAYWTPPDQAIPADDPDANKPYPQINDWVIAEGTLKQYAEDDNPNKFLYIDLSSLTIDNENRGSEFVSQ
jgi:zinc transport system permease protein